MLHTLKQHGTRVDWSSETVTESFRCAIYARFSSEKQNPLSTDQQIRKCREYANRNGMHVLDDHIYADEAISGDTENRAALQQLLTTAKQKPRPFDVLLVDDTSRLSRRLVDSLKINEQLQFVGVRVVFIAQGFDTSSEQAELLVATHGIVDSLYLKDLAKRTFRGVEQLAIQGLHTGGRVFGYRHVPIESATRRDSYGRPAIEGVRLAIDPDQAATIRRMFERYASGHSMKRIAIDLNHEGILSPQPREGRSQSWAQSSVRHILLNERYRGIVYWGKTRKIRSPKGTRIYQRRPQNEWRRADIPEQRIVTDELWDRVQERLKLVQDLYGVREGKRRGRAAASPYLFTGLLVCSQCGGSITIVSGRCRKRQDSRYGCSMHAQRGDKVCTNGLLVRRLDLERQLLAGLQERVLHPEVVDYTLNRFEEELRKAVASRHQGDADLRRHAAELERSISNQLRGLSDGYSTAITTEISRLERQLAAVRERLRAFDPHTIRVQVRDTRRFIEDRLNSLNLLWEGEPRIARDEIAKHLRKITLRPMLRTYVATGVWDWLGGLEPAATMVVPGARTARCRLRFGSAPSWRRSSRCAGTSRKEKGRNSGLGPQSIDTEAATLVLRSALPVQPRKGGVIPGSSLQTMK
jgi:DNA invertase Pin-like site-specific DNA recombinase